MKYRIVFLILFAGILPFTFQTRAEEGASKNPAKNPIYAEANAALKEARMHMGNAESAQERTERLENILERYPDYPLRADLFYYAGINYQVLRQYDKAVTAFESALRAEPGIADETPIDSYLRAAKRQALTDRLALILIAVLAVTLVLSIARILRADAAVIRWRPLLSVCGLMLVIWIAIVLLLPALLGCPSAGLENYPKPTLLNFRIGQLGDDSLRMLLYYGAGAILAMLPVMAAVSLVKRPSTRKILGLLGVIAAAGSLMGLYGVRICYGHCQYDSGNKRLLFLVKDIATKEDVPDEMLPLYDESLRAKIIESRKQEAK